MNLLDELRHDHLRLRAALSSLALAPARGEHLRELATGLEEHFRLEDELLFRELERGLPEHDRLLVELREEHREFEDLLRSIGIEAEPSAPLVARLASALREHFVKEEEGLFPFAERLLDGERLSALGAAHRQSAAVTDALPPLTAETRVADLARLHPATIRVFQRHGIDFCCGGKLPVVEACARNGADVTTVLGDLRAAVEHAVPGTEPNWSARPAVEIVGHILARYHTGLRDELGRLVAMSARAADRHGATHRELLEIRDLVAKLATEMTGHLEREEREIFPALLHGDVAAVGDDLAAAEAEHEEVGDLLARLRRATDGFRPPIEACNTWRGLFHGLAELERDTHVHVHLENNVLFPKAVAAAAAR
jgi:regulator of cell morphogenesis and NO signaling